MHAFGLPDHRLFDAFVRGEAHLNFGLSFEEFEELEGLEGGFGEAPFRLSLSIEQKHSDLVCRFPRKQALSR